MNEIVNTDYANWLQSISERYRQSQIKAAVAVNAEMLKFYFGLGADIVRMEKDQPWGSGFLKRLSLDLKMQRPEVECFSVTNLKYMRWFWQVYAPVAIGPQVRDQLGVTIWTLESSQQPIGVSEFKIQEILPKEIESDLPSIAEIESEIERNVI